MKRLLLMAILGVACAGFAAPLAAQEPAAAEEIPIERCDRLPVVRVRAAKTEMRFLVDTGATTMLNLKSFAQGQSKSISVTSWSGTAATSAREVALDELALGSHVLRNLKLPAIDLSPIGKACGGPIDGILGVDLLDRMGVTLDLKRQVASLGAEPADAKKVYEQMETAMHHCSSSFEQGKAEDFEKCFDPEIVLYTPHGEYQGRQQVMEYIRQRYFRFAPDHLHYAMQLHDVKMFGDALWYSYDYTIDTPEKHTAGHGMAMCHKSQGQWLILNMHNSLKEPEAGR